MNLTSCLPAIAMLCGFAAAAQKPNILVIVSDDQGYADAGFQGSREIITPHLDKLAKSGLRCTNGYVTHPYCSPTRAALLTGRYQARFGHERNPRYLPENHTEGLPLSETLFPSDLARGGYTTGWIGKWHLGAAPEFHPQNRGFTETFGFIGGGHNYQNWKTGDGEYNIPILRDGKPQEVKEHLTLAFGHEAAAFINRHQDQPWFLYLAFNAPHTPHQPTAERLARFGSIKDPQRRAYAAQISLMDDAIGETLDALHTTSQDQRTLVFFFSDNGGPRGGGPDNAPLRGYKGDLYEGGVRIPFIVSWPGTLPHGRDYDDMVSSLDVAATSLAIGGIPNPTEKPLDGVNLIPFLSGKITGSPHETLFWRENTTVTTAVRDGNDKFVRKNAEYGEVYDLKQDIGEHDNRTSTDPERAKALQTKLDEWMARMSRHLVFIGLGDKPEKPWPVPASVTTSPKSSSDIPKPTR